MHVSATCSLDIDSIMIMHQEEAPKFAERGRPQTWKATRLPG